MLRKREIMSRGLLLGNGINARLGIKNLSVESIGNRFNKNVLIYFDIIRVLFHVELEEKFLQDLERKGSNIGIETLAEILYEHIKKNKKDNWSVNDEIRVLDVLICICITSIFFTTEGKISSIYDPQKLPSLNKYDSIYTLNYYEFWDADHKCIHLHGRIHLEKVGDVKNAILVSTERMNLEEYARTIESMRTIYSVIEIRPSEFILAPEKHEKSKLYNVLGLRTSKGLYPAKDLQPRPARRLYTELDKIDELDILGMSPYGDDSIIDNINKKKKVRIYIYNKKSNAETEVWKKKLTCDYELFDSEEI